MGSAHRAPIVDSTLSGCSALSQTGLAHRTSDIFNIQFSKSNIEYWISTFRPSVCSFISYGFYQQITRGADKMGKTLLRTLSKSPNTSLHLAPTSHTPIRLEAHPLSHPHTLHTWSAQHTSCYVLIAYWFLEAQEKAPQQTKYDSLMKSEWKDKPASREAPWYCRDNEEADPTQTPKNLSQW